MEQGQELVPVHKHLFFCFPPLQRHIEGLWGGCKELGAQAPLGCLAVLPASSQVQDYLDWPLQSDYNTEEMACHLHHFKILFPVLSPVLSKLFPAILSPFPEKPSGLSQSAALSFLTIADPMVFLSVFPI